MPLQRVIVNTHVLRVAFKWLSQRNHALAAHMVAARRCFWAQDMDLNLGDPLLLFG